MVSYTELQLEDLGQFLELSGAQFPLLQNEEPTTYFPKWVRGEIMHHRCSEHTSDVRQTLTQQKL